MAWRRPPASLPCGLRAPAPALPNWRPRLASIFKKSTAHSLVRGFAHEYYIAQVGDARWTAGLPFTILDPNFIHARICVDEPMLVVSCALELGCFRCCRLRKHRTRCIEKRERVGKGESRGFRGVPTLGGLWAQGGVCAHLGPGVAAASGRWALVGRREAPLVSLRRTNHAEQALPFLYGCGQEEGG